jgi:hypothetical protein
MHGAVGEVPMKSKKKKATKRHSRAEAAHYAKTLEANRQIAHGKRLTPGTTHQLVTGPKGKRIVVRRRYSAT